MLFTANLLHQLEQSSSLKQKYLTAGSVGNNKMVILPVILAVAGLYGAYELHDLSRPDNDLSTYMYISLAVAVISIIAIVLIQRSTKSKMAASLDDVPACIAKKIYGNFASGIYYGIYTPGPRRHDIEFIEDVAFKIFNINLEPDAELRKKIEKMFDVKFADPRGATVLLPTALTAGEEVYQRQFALNTIGRELNNMVNEENEGRFIVYAFNKTNAVPLREADILPYLAAQ